MPSTSFERTQFHASPEILAEMERTDTDKLSNIVKDAISAASYSCGISEDTLLSILGKLQVETVGQMKGYLESLMQRGEIDQMDAKNLSNALEAAISSIADATDLDTAEICEVFVREKFFPIDAIVESLRARSRADRADQV